MLTLDDLVRIKDLEERGEDVEVAWVEPGGVVLEVPEEEEEEEEGEGQGEESFVLDWEPLPRSANFKLAYTIIFV